MTAPSQYQLPSLSPVTAGPHSAVETSQPCRALRASVRLSGAAEIAAALRSLGYRVVGG